MIHMHKGSQAGSLAAILSVVGEYPYSSLRLLGNERYFRTLVHKLTEKNELYNSESGERVFCKFLNLSGKGSSKTIRLYREAVPILNWIYPQYFGCVFKDLEKAKFMLPVRFKELTGENFVASDTDECIVEEDKHGNT